MQELVVSSFAYITNDNDQDRWIHLNETLKNFELSLSFSLVLTWFIWKLNMYWAFHVHTDFSVCSKDDDNCAEIFSIPLQLLSLFKKWGSCHQGTITSSGVYLNSLLTGEFCKNMLLSTEVRNTSLRVFTFAGFFPLNSAGLRTRNIWKRKEK